VSKLQASLNTDRAQLCGDLLARAGDGDVKLFATHIPLQA